MNLTVKGKVSGHCQRQGEQSKMRKEEGNRSKRINDECTGKDYWNLTMSLG